MLGILLARMVIVPMDPNDPLPRLQSIVDDAEPAIVITQGPVAAEKARALRPPPPPPPPPGEERRGAAARGAPLVLDAAALDSESGSGGGGAEEALAGGDVSHVYFTSGSTGQPKAHPHPAPSCPPLLATVPTSPIASIRPPPASRRCARGAVRARSGGVIFARELLAEREPG
jgi:non-ribosomal peptide synthetase component F